MSSWGSTFKCRARWCRRKTKRAGSDTSGQMTSAATAVGIVLAILGVLLLLFGVGGYSACSSDALTTWTGCTPLIYAMVAGALLLAIGILVAVYAARSYTYIAPTGNPAVPPPLVTPVVIHQTVEQQVVRIRCRYCGTLGDPRVGRCANCGAPL